MADEHGRAQRASLTPAQARSCSNTALESADMRFAPLNSPPCDAALDLQPDPHHAPQRWLCDIHRSWTHWQPGLGCAGCRLVCGRSACVHCAWLGCLDPSPPPVATRLARWCLALSRQEGCPPLKIARALLHLVHWPLRDRAGTPLFPRTRARSGCMA